jgi:hypothetical protein
MEGKYIPTHPSNTKKEVIRAASGGATEDDAAVALPMAMAATVSMAVVDLSVATPDLAS